MNNEKTEFSVVPVDDSTGNNETQTTHFIEQDSGYISYLPDRTVNAEVYDKTLATNLEDFLKRPVRILSLDWDNSDVLGPFTVIEPWYAFLSNAAIQNKLQNYAFLRGVLKIKLIINSTPFNYGAMLMHYQPLPTFTPSTIASSTVFYDVIPKSQRPHQWIFPTENRGCEMTLPFLWPKNWINIQNAQETKDVGKLSFDIVTALRSANGAITSTATAHVYAWMEEVHLSGPSVGLTLQAGQKVSALSTGANSKSSKLNINMEKAKSYGNSFQRYTAVTQDEYDGWLSKPASAIAAAVGCLSNLPVIGYYARAADIGLKAVAGVASLFGWTNVPVIEDVKPFQNRNMPSMASCEISYPVEKLTLDPKNELCVDSSFLGDTNQDNLVISNLIQRESYVDTMAWSTSDAYNKILGSSVVTPLNFGFDTLTTGSQFFTTPACHISQLFENWRGDLIYRFKFVCTKFHKGRVRISYDPSGLTASNLYNTQENTSQILNRIVDLDECTEMEFRIPYQQALPWLRCGNFTTTNKPFDSSPSPSFVYDNTLHNGSWCVQVLTTLSAPVTSSTIGILLFVRCADNFEFANPRNINSEGNYYSNLAPQAGVVQLTDNTNINSLSISNDTQSNINPNRYLENFGEAIYSLRTLLRRYSLNYAFSYSGSGNSVVLYKNVMSRLPKPFGYDSGGSESAAKLSNPLLFNNFNFVFTHPITWVQAMFIGYRGSTMVAMSTEGDATTQNRSLRAYRNVNSNVTTPRGILSSLPNDTSDASRFYLAQSFSGASGQSYTNCLNQPSINIGCPHYSKYKFQSTNINNICTPSVIDDSDRNTITYEQSSYSQTLNFYSNIQKYYYAIGSDFSFVFFLNTPTIYRYGSLPSAPA